MFRMTLGSLLAVFVTILVVSLIAARDGPDADSQEPAAWLWKPEGSPVGVRFWSEPLITPIQVPGPSGDLISGEKAEILFSNGSFQRAEHLPFARDILVSISEAGAVADMQRYAYFQGIRVGEFHYEEGPRWKHGAMRGYKVLEDPRGGRLPATFEMHVYYGSESVMMLYTGGPSSTYPSPAIAQFMASPREGG